MKTANMQTDRPEITQKGTAMAVFFWVLYTLFNTAILSNSENLPFLHALSGMGLSSFIMAMLMIPPWFLIVRGLYNQGWWIKSVAHLVSGIIYTFCWYYLYLFAFDLFFGRELLGEGFRQNSGWILLTTCMVYVIVFAVIHTIESLKQLRLKEKQASELKELSRQQEIANLKAQLNPHFLFNTLNSINATVTKDPEETREMITKLSEMLRYSLESFEKEQVSLAEELNFVKTYLDLEQRRLGNRLKVSFDVDEEITDLPVPPMILQPLVENAVKHGISSLEGGGSILVQIKQQKNSVLFSVEDTGKGMPPDYKENLNGIGLRNTNEMLVKRFGKSHGLKVVSNKPKGTSVSFSIPF